MPPFDRIPIIAYARYSVPRFRWICAKPSRPDRGRDRSCDGRNNSNALLVALSGNVDDVSADLVFRRDCDRCGAWRNDWRTGIALVKLQAKLGCNRTIVFTVTDRVDQPTYVPELDPRTTGDVLSTRRTRACNPAIGH